MAKAGEFEVRVYDPYPCWCEIRYEGRPIMIGDDRHLRINHMELSDLHYAVEKAMQEARAKLPPDSRGEV
jgi:hypothetical protein